jgi:argonaute-like protein implicated in RNA metabolism and viral defense
VSDAWVAIGGHQVRIEQIAAWRHAYYNGVQTHVVYVTLLSGQRIEGEVTRDQWKAFQAAMPDV